MFAREVIGQVERMQPVSAIVATRDRPELLRAAIRSMLDQEPFGPQEVIVVFDQTEPDQSLVEEFAPYRIRVTPNTRTPGLPGARNSGIELAEGEWVAFCDDDDVWMPDRLATQLAVAGPVVDFVVGGIRIAFGAKTYTRTPGTTQLTFHRLLRSRVMGAHSSTFLVRRSALLGSLGLDDEEIPGQGYNEDYDWLLRAARLKPVVAVDAPLALVAWHPDSFYRNRWRAAIDATTALIAKTPEFETTRAGMARLTGHMAFAHAGLGESREALRMALRTFRLDPRQLRIYITLAVLTKAVKADWLVRKANSVGRGI